MSGTEGTIEAEPETASDDTRGARNRKRVKTTVVVLAGLGFIIGGALLDPDPESSEWVAAAPASSQPPYSGPGPTSEQVTADFEAAAAAAGVGPAAPPRAFTVPGCLAPWETYGDVGEARLAALLENLNNRQWQLTRRQKTKSAVASSLTKGTWHLMVVHRKRPGTPEHLALVATNSTPACEEAAEQAQTDGVQAV
ncbi:hypothetical protein ACFYYM_37395 [Streptomyces erythrochromogenes]|uniref:hypothetical protein n=1 Tax=Streptomyces erythrochromogenes TaxID=285574 RepID=UPI0036963A1D